MARDRRCVDQEPPNKRLLHDGALVLRCAQHRAPRQSRQALGPLLRAPAGPSFRFHP
jgi:hypothetical protein